MSMQLLLMKSSHPPSRSKLFHEYRQFVLLQSLQFGLFHLYLLQGGVSC